MHKEDFRNKLAVNPTKAETALIYAMANDKNLRGRYKFQKLLEPYIVDFYFESCGLVVEVDGWSHDYANQYDTRRTNYLIKNHSVKNVIRFSNKEVYLEIRQVLNSIKRYVCPRSVKSIKPIVKTNRKNKYHLNR